MPWPCSEVPFSEGNLTVEFCGKRPKARKRPVNKSVTFGGHSVINTGGSLFGSHEENLTAQVFHSAGNLSPSSTQAMMHPPENVMSSSVTQGTSTTCSLLPDGRRWTVVSSSDSQHPGTNRMLCAVGSVGFHACRHMWKAQVFGNVLQGFTFGICSRGTDGTPGQQGNWWVWNFQQVYKVVNQNSSQATARTESTITDCVSGDIIEFYLDCENGTLVMHNLRTEQWEALDGVEGNVVPVFRSTTKGDKVSLKVKFKNQCYR